MARSFWPSLMCLLVAGAGIAGCGDEQGSASPNTSGVKSPQVGKPGVTLPPKSHSGSGDRLANFAGDAVGSETKQEPSVFRFTEIAKEAGITFSQVSGMTDEKHFPTANGSGVAIFDYDGDGKMDLYFANCTYFPVGSKKSGPNRLYRNLGDGTKFQDVTAESGLGFEGFCHGIIAADIDNDGDQDVLLCNHGPNVLYLNDGKGHFKDVSKAAGIARDGWSSGGAPIDYDNDGDLDLYVANYGEWDLKRDGERRCSDTDGKLRLYCNPKEIRTVKHFLYRNDGLKDGVPHFTNVYDEFLFDESKGAFIPGRADGHGFGVVTADLNGDGLTDIYVANDMCPNFLFLNLGGGRFKDATDESGAAFNEKGAALSGMGVDAEDVDGDGRPELVVTNFQNEPVTLYYNLGKGTFSDSTPTYGLAADTMRWVKWGCAFADFDNDGWPDFFITNGHVDNNRPNISYEEPPLLLRNVALGVGKDASRRFRISTRDVGPYFDSKHVGRGAAFGDFNDDGRIDIVVNHKDAPPAVLRNDTKLGDNHWIRLKLRGTKSNRDAVGARIEVTAGKHTIYRQRKGGYSMESSNDPRVLIGIGPVDTVSKVVIHWPAGGPDSVLENIEANKSYDVIEPEGK
jgi:enediyne biosynthesis protein E4